MPESPTARPPDVLFVCIHDAGWSQMTAALPAHHAGDRVVVRSAGTAPAYPGKRYLDWAVADPAGQGVDAVRVIRQEIDRRVRALVTELIG